MKNFLAYFIEFTFYQCFKFQWKFLFSSSKPRSFKNTIYEIEFQYKTGFKFLGLSLDKIVSSRKQIHFPIFQEF